MSHRACEAARGSEMRGETGKWPNMPNLAYIKGCNRIGLARLDEKLDVLDAGTSPDPECRLIDEEVSERKREKEKERKRESERGERDGGRKRKKSKTVGVVPRMHGEYQTCR